MMDDTELLRQYAESRSENAFAELVKRRIGLVYSVALRHTRDAQRAEDVTQVVFMALARKANRLARRPVVVGWLFRSAQFAAIDAVRAESRRQAREQEAHTMEQLVHDAPEPDWNQLRPVLDEVLNDMDERDRDAVLLRFFDGQPFAEIGAKLRLTENAARMRVERALEKMHTALARRGVTSTASALTVALANQAGVAAPAGLAATVTSAVLAATTAGTGSVAAATAAFTFMSTGNVVAIIAIVGGLSAVGFGVYERSERVVAEGAHTAALRERDELRGKLSAIAQNSAAQPRSGAAARVANRADAPDNTSGNDYFKATTAQSVAATQAVNRLITSDPDYQKAFVDSVRGGYAVRFGPFYKMLNLSAEQVARFEQRLTEGAHQQIDFLAAAQAKGVSPTDPSLASFRAKEKADYESDIRAILGETGLQEYLRYERMYGGREWTNTLLGNLIYVEAPMSAQQVNQLTQLLAENSPSYQKGGAMRSRASDVAWEGVLAQAPQFLSPMQVEVLRIAAEQARASKRMQELTAPFFRSVSPSQPAVPPTGPATPKPSGG